jgi:DNA-directed RNA polymerase specialized sigma24 family protein
MSDDTSFADFLRRIRAGDQQAAAELVRRYEPAIRLEVRMRLSDPRLGRLFDSMDVCQSVLKSFFVRTAAGQYDLDEPGQLLRLLVVMARNKLALRARHEGRQRRNYRRVEVATDDRVEVAKVGPSPSEVMAGRELLQEVRQRLTEEERCLADLRGQGRAWKEIAAELGGTAGARRKQFERAVDRVARELGLDEDGLA